LPEPATSIMWINKSIYLTARSEYFTVDVLENSIAPLVSFESAPPVMRLLSSGELIMKQDRKGVLTDGMMSKNSSLSVQVSPLTWTTSPSDLIVHFPYVLSLQADQIEVHSTFSWKMFQRIALSQNVPVSSPPPSSTIMSPSSSSHSLSTSSPPGTSTNVSLSALKSFVPRNTALIGFDELFVLAHSERSVFAFVAPKYPSQAETLVNTGNIEEGLFLLEQTCDEMRDYPNMFAKLHTLAAWSRFKSGDWKRSIVHFANAKASPAVIIPSFPSLLLIDSQKTTEEDKIINNVIKKFLPRGASDADQDKSLREASIYLTEFLEALRAGEKYDEPTELELIAAIFISKVRYGTPGIGAAAMSSSKATWNFLSSLTESEQALSLAFLEHWCTVNRFYVTLGLIFRLRRLNRKALEEWSKVGSGERTCQDPSQSGIDESISLLQTIDDIELLEEFAPKVYANSGKNASKFLSIFASKERATLLHLSWIQNFFQQYDKSLFEQYLEYLVFELDVKDEKVETTLALQYLSAISASSDVGAPVMLNGRSSLTTQMVASSANASSSAASPSSSSSTSSTSSVVPPFPPSSISSSPSVELQRSSLTGARKKLLALLEQKSSFNAHALLVRVESLPLPFEKVALYERIGDHEKALGVIVHVLQDFDRAETYCLLHEHEGSDVLISALLRVYLAMDPDLRAGMPEGEGFGGDDGLKLPRRALDLIERFPTKLRPSTVISTLPPDTPLHAIEPFLVQSIRAHLAMLRHNAILQGIEKSNNLKVSTERLALSQRSFIISQNTTCPVCNRPIQPGMFARFPNNVLVHVPCVNNKHIDPITGRNFFRHPQE